MHEAVTAAWERVVEKWDDLARHEALLGLAAHHDSFAWVAARYRERAGDPIADKQLEQLRKAATATMLATATRKPHETAAGPYRKTLVWLGVLVLMLVLGLVFTKVVLEGGARLKAPKARSAPAGRPIPARH